MLLGVGEETKTTVIQTDPVGYRQMMVLFGSDLVCLFCLSISRISLGEIREGFGEGRKGFMVCELGIWEDKAVVEATKFEGEEETVFLFL